MENDLGSRFPQGFAGLEKDSRGRLPRKHFRHGLLEHRRRFVTAPTLLAAWALASALTWPADAAAQTGANVLVVINVSSPASKQVGEYYSTARMVPESPLPGPVEP